jgi:hypothetical protein
VKLPTPLYRDSTGVWRSPLFDAERWLEHGFGTALARPAGEWLELKQIHSNVVLDACAWREGVQADALTSATPGAALAVRSADCLPILLADPRHRAVAAVHAGWRGSAAAIAERAVECMRERYGSRPGELLAAFGPSIRRCCFEVGPEVAREFAAWFPERSDLDRRAHVDLPEVSRRQLIAAGIPAERIAAGAPCTVCGGAEFHSYRRDRDAAGRMHSVVRILPSAGPG